LNITLTAAAGAGRVDLSQMIVKVGNNVNQTTLNYSAAAPSATSFNIYMIRDPSALYSDATPVIDGSSLVGVNIDLTLHTPRPYFSVRSQYHIELIPEHGATTTIDGVTPATYSTSLQALYP
jgi:archaellin